MTARNTHPVKRRRTLSRAELAKRHTRAVRAARLMANDLVALYQQDPTHPRHIKEPHA